MAYEGFIMYKPYSICVSYPESRFFIEGMVRGVKMCQIQRRDHATC